jgi:hypothetical protein
MRISRFERLNGGRVRFFLLLLSLAFGFTLIFSMSAYAEEWSAPEQELARKIAAAAGGGTISLALENRSSLGRRDAEIIQNGLRSALTSMGMRLVANDPTAATVMVSLSENLASYAWVAQVERHGAEPAVVMVAVPREADRTTARHLLPMSLQKTLLWNWAEPILDIAVLEENGGFSRMAVLTGENVSIYRIRGGNAQMETTAEIPHSKPWPRDLRGRIIPEKDRALDVYLPGIRCRSTTGTPFTLNCREGDDPWPLMFGELRGKAADAPASLSASFEASRNFFTGIAVSDGGLKTAPQFYSAAIFPGDGTSMWLFAALDGKVHVFEGTADHVADVNWGSDLTSIRTSCGAGWQVLATSPNEDGTDLVRAFEIPERDPVAVSAAVDFSGPISALWTEAKGDSAIAVARNTETGNYEAFRLAMACGE